MNINDLDYSVTELNIAIKDHYDWAEKLLRLSLLEGEADQEILDPDSHLHCRFSQWLALRIDGAALDKDMVIQIDKSHTAIHNIARKTMQSIMAKTVTNELLEKYHCAQRNFINGVDRYKEYLISYRNMHDALTGLPLRHLLYQDFPLIYAGCECASRHLYLLIMDIDRFKSINDTWGHNAGDDVLRNVALTLKAAMRKSERIYRFGGEEFIILLDAQQDADAQHAAGRIRQYLHDHNITVAGHTTHVTVTGGLTRVFATDSLHDAIGRADKAMYYGKNTGRNRCIMVNAECEMFTIK